MAATVHKVGAIAEIPAGEGRVCEVGARRIAIFHGRDGQVYATQAVCPHKGGPLADGILGSGQLVCPLHDWRFDLATGATENGSCPIDVYQATVDPEGNVTVEIP
jgi:nitrite reductase (NADH) small subunit